MSESALDTPLRFVEGVGPRRADLLAKLHLHAVSDLLFTLPRDILDLSHVSGARDLKEGRIYTVRGRVVDLDGRSLSSGKTLSAALIDCHDGHVRGVWFNQPWMLQKLQHNQLVLFSGKVKRQAGRWEMAHPHVQWLEDDEQEAGGEVLPRYSLTDGLKMHEMRRIARQAATAFSDLLPDILPEELRLRCNLLALPVAIRAVHLPATALEWEAGRRRLIFQDLLEFQLGLAMRRRMWRQRSAAPRLINTTKIDSRIRRLLPFELTAGQDRAIAEVCADLASGWSMHRLLQADVGAGKTVVAVYAMLVAVAAGYQVALMAPTELLAQQHWQTIDALLAHSRVQRMLLTGQLSAAERRRALEGLRGGSLQLVVGTQALIQQDVEFQKLGLVVIDEQHKFGVMQRAHFAARGLTPHTLVMTATPIPRSLCLTQFGDLDLSVMTELPPGRQRVVTSRLTSGASEAKAWQFIRDKLNAGRQLYVICPRVETTPGEAGGDLRGVRETYDQLAAGELKGYDLALVHGQLESEAKERAMQSFRRGESRVLISTTVVEVGVDVPNATLMVIQSARSFGLSQLHQLRGRISRGKFQGYCFLIADATQAEASSRLEALERHASGFEIAEVDFALRGPGDVLGVRQHGELPLRVADLVRDAAVLEEVRPVAFDLVDSGTFDQPEYAPLKLQVLERFGKLLDLVGTG